MGAAQNLSTLNLLGFPTPQLSSSAFFLPHQEAAHEALALGAINQPVRHSGILEALQSATCVRVCVQAKSKASRLPTHS